MTRITDEMDSIRRNWSEEERETRKKLAGVMQLQLRQLVVLAELTGFQQKNASTEVASAC